MVLGNFKKVVEVKIDDVPKFFMRINLRKVPNLNFTIVFICLTLLRN